MLQKYFYRRNLHFVTISWSVRTSLTNTDVEHQTLHPKAHIFHTLCHTHAHTYIHPPRHTHIKRNVFKMYNALAYHAKACIGRMMFLYELF